MKQFCRFLAPFTALLLLLSVSAQAAGSVSFSADTMSFTVAPGSSYSTSDTWDAFKDLYPGDVRTQEITVQNSSAADRVEIFFRANAASEEDRALLSQLTVKAEVKSAKASGVSGLFAGTLYEAPADTTGSLTDWVSLGTFAPGGTVVLEVTLSVPLSLANEFQEAQAKLLWDYKAAQVTAPPTGDSPELYVFGGLTLLCLSAAAVLTVRRRRAQKTE